MYRYRYDDFGVEYLPVYILLPVLAGMMLRWSDHGPSIVGPFGKQAIATDNDSLQRANDLLGGCLFGSTDRCNEPTYATRCNEPLARWNVFLERLVATARWNDFLERMVATARWNDSYFGTPRFTWEI